MLIRMVVRKTIYEGGGDKLNINYKAADLFTYNLKNIIE